MRKIFLIIVSLSIYPVTFSQVLTVTPGTDLTINAGTLFRVENLTLLPYSNFVITNNSLARYNTTLHPTSNAYISRVYRFTNNTSPFLGTIQFNYEDGIELNNIDENSLTLNLHNGNFWTVYPAAIRNTSSNFVLSITDNNTVLNELTLADINNPLLAGITILGNLVTNDILTVQVNATTHLKLIAINGAVVWQQKVSIGTLNIDVSRFPKGIYLLTTPEETKKIIIR
jgi:hypothetical protein